MRKFWEQIELLNACKIKKYLECTDKSEYLQKPQPQGYNCEIWRNISLRCIFSMYSRRCLKTIETCNLLKIYSARITFMPTEKRCSTNCKLRVHWKSLWICSQILKKCLFKSEAWKRIVPFFSTASALILFLLTNTSLRWALAVSTPVHS